MDDDEEDENEVNFELLRDEHGRYPVDIARIISSANPEKKAVLTEVGVMVIEHRQYEEAWLWLKEVLQESDTGLEATAGLFYGVSGVGKSTLLRNFVYKFGQSYPTEAGMKRAVVRVSTPANPTLPNVYKAMVRALGAEESLSNDADDLRSVVLAQLKGQDIKLVIFDEFTHVVEDRSDKYAIKVVRALKELLSEKRCQVVFAGTEDLEKIHRNYGQFQRRSGGDFQFYPFDWDDDDDSDESDDKLEWKEMMDTLQEKLPIKCASPLGSQEMFVKMHQATDGIMDHVMKLLFRATSFAFDEGKGTISDKNLATAFERLRRGNRKKVNPFGKPAGRVAGIRVSKFKGGTPPPPDDEDGLTNLRANGKGPKPDFRK